MSWHFLQGQEEASWEENSLDGAPSALLKLMPTVEECSLPAKETESCHPSPSGTMSEHLTDTHGEGTLTSSPGVSHAMTSALRGIESASVVNGPHSGEKWPASLVRFDPVSSLWKTHQSSLLGGWVSFSETWPRWGMMQGGECWALATLEHPTDAIEYGSLPTPAVSTHWSNKSPTKGAAVRLSLHGMAQKNGGKLNPKWVSWLMKWPIGWTAIEPLEMVKYQKWLDSHGKY